MRSEDAGTIFPHFSVRVFFFGLSLDLKEILTLVCLNKFVTRLIKPLFKISPFLLRF